MFTIADHGGGVTVTHEEGGDKAELNSDCSSTNRWISFNRPMENGEFLHLLNCRHSHPNLEPHVKLMIRASNMKLSKEQLESSQDYNIHAATETEDYSELEVDIHNRNLGFVNLHFTKNLLFVTNNERIYSVIIPQMGLEKALQVYIYLGERMTGTVILPSFHTGDTLDKVVPTDEQNAYGTRLSNEKDELLKDIQKYISIPRGKPPALGAQITSRANRSLKGDNTIIYPKPPKNIRKKNFGTFYWNEALKFTLSTSKELVNMVTDVTCCIEIYEGTDTNAKPIYAYENISIQPSFFLFIRRKNMHNFYNGFNVYKKNKLTYKPKECMDYTVRISVSGGTKTGTWKCCIFRIEEPPVHDIFRRETHGVVHGGTSVVLTNEFQKNTITKQFLHATAQKDRLREYENLVDAAEVQLVNHVHTVIANVNDDGTKLEDIQALRLTNYSQKSLADEIKDTNLCMSPAKIIEYMTELVIALNKHHKNNVVYRDLKPDNIITSRGIVLIDIGSAINLNKTKTVYPSQLKNGLTWRYAPPEAVLNLSEETHYTLAFDVYSLGVVFYEFLNRKLIDDKEGSREKHFVPCPPLVKRTEGINFRECNFILEYTDKMIEKCLDKDPANRPTLEKIQHYLTSCDINRPSAVRVKF